MTTMKTTRLLPARRRPAALLAAALLLLPSLALAQYEAAPGGDFAGGDGGAGRGGGAGGGGGGGQSRLAPPPLAANPSPTAKARLAAAGHAIEQAQAALARAASSPAGGSLDLARAAAARALADVADATVFLAAHPELNALPAGPAPAETSLARPVTLTQSGRGASSAPGVNLLTALEALNLALNEFLNNPSPTYTGPVIGSLDGHREKIMADLAAAATAVAVTITTRPAVPAQTGQRGAATPSSAPATTLTPLASAR